MSNAIREIERALGLPETGELSPLNFWAILREIRILKADPQ